MRRGRCVHSVWVANEKMMKNKKKHNHRKDTTLPKKAHKTTRTRQNVVFLSCCLPSFTLLVISNFPSIPLSIVIRDLFFGVVLLLTQHDLLICTWYLVSSFQFSIFDFDYASPRERWPFNCFHRTRNTILFLPKFNFDFNLSWIKQLATSLGQSLKICFVHTY